MGHGLKATGHRCGLPALGLALRARRERGDGDGLDELAIVETRRIAGATYGDVAELVDVIYSVGLDRIYFGR